MNLHFIKKPSIHNIYIYIALSLGQTNDWKRYNLLHYCTDDRPAFILPHCSSWNPLNIFSNLLNIFFRFRCSPSSRPAWTRSTAPSTRAPAGASPAPWPGASPAPSTGQRWCSAILKTMYICTRIFAILRNLGHSDRITTPNRTFL